MDNLTDIIHITFDLDGTLINSYNTIYKSTEIALKQLNINEPLVEDIFHEQIGHHFVDIFKAMDIPLPDFDEFIDIYKNVYFDFIDESSFYPNVLETIKYLNEKDVKISLLTTKGQDQADRIIDHFGLRKYFSFVMGRRPGIANKPSGEPLQFICKNLNVSPEFSLMVGDTELDINCGKNAKAKTCGVLYGYRTQEKLSAEKPDFLISNIEEITGIIDGKVDIK